MILIPEVETVVILVPRTGSGSLRRAIAARYPRAMLVYRHMEADGVPRGYDRWRKVGVVREPLDRLWSLYKFMRTYRDPNANQGQAYLESLRRCSDRPFSDWIVHNETVFTAPYDSAPSNRYWPHYTVNHALPENRKSQWLYLRPDLGTELFPYADLSLIARNLDVSLPRENRTDPEPPPALSADAFAHMDAIFEWDMLAAADAYDRAERAA
jgi:hypothetical protein